MPTNTNDKIINAVSAARRVILVCHPGPDADTLGAASAFKLFLDELGTESLIFCKTPAPKDLYFLPFAQDLTTDPSVFNDERVDVVIGFDAGDLRYLGIDNLVPHIPGGATIINIDHHTSNEFFGDINLVNLEGASTTEVLYHFFTETGSPITEKMSTCLLAGIINDTAHFSNAATSARAMEVSSSLVSSGAHLHTIREKMLNNKSVNLLKLWGIALSRLYYQADAQAIITYLFEDDYKAFNLKPDELHGLPNFLSSINEGSFTMLLTEQPGGVIKGSLRTTKDDVDVSVIAKKYGGGGHQKAAGFSLSGRLQETDRGVKIIS